jgi:type III pantothenate kinase
VARFVADLGNSRLKWGRLDPSGRLVETIALPIAVESAWLATRDAWGAGGAESSWTVATVNPPLASRLRAWLEASGVAAIRWFTSAAEVPLRHALERPETTGADRALAVFEAVARSPRGRPGLVVSCGTAITVERVSAEGVWEGGAIAPGLALSTKSLHMMTAQLPIIEIVEAPPAWGRATEPALAAGVYWGVVGSIRELLTRQAEGFTASPWCLWTGGDAPRLAPWVAWPGAEVVPDLVLLGLARLNADP